MDCKYWLLWHKSSHYWFQLNMWGHMDYRLTPPVVGYGGLDRPWRAILFWKAVGETIWAEDMVAILCKAFSLAAWSWRRTGRERENVRGHRKGSMLIRLHLSRWSTSRATNQCPKRGNGGLGLACIIRISLPARGLRRWYYSQGLLGQASSLLLWPGQAGDDN